MDPVYHREKGVGHPLILIHGFCESGEIWSRFADGLAQKFRVITPDLPGFGRSPLPQDSFSIEGIGSIMLDWMSPWQADNPIVVGHSLGGYVALAMAGQRPDWFGAWDFSIQQAYADSEEKKASRDKVIAFVKRHGVAPFVETFVPGLFYQKQNPHMEDVHQIASQTSPETLLAYSAAMRDRHSYENLLVTFSRPILFIAGEGDALLPVQQVIAQSKIVRFPVFHSLADAGHMGMMEMEPVSLKIVEDFVNFSIDFGATGRYLF